MLALKPVIVFMVITLSLYLAQVISVQIRIYIPHLDVIEGDHRYVYKYGSSEIDGLFPLFGLWAFSGDGARVIEYSIENGHETLLRVHSVDLFSDFDKYSSHITRGLTSR